MKQTYMRPAIRVKAVNVESNLLDASIPFGGSANKDTRVDAKHWGVFAGDSEADKTIDWDDEE